MTIELSFNCYLHNLSDSLAQRIATGLSDLFLPFILVSLPLQIIYIMCSYALHIMMFPVQILAKLEVYLSRIIEYRADNFAADLIGTNGVISFLETTKKIEKHMVFGFLNMKSRSHPPSEYRIEKLLCNIKHVPESLVNVQDVIVKTPLDIRKKYTQKVHKLLTHVDEEDLTSFI